MRRRYLAALLPVLAGCALAACGQPVAPPATTTTTVPVGGATLEPLTPGVEAQLLAAGAALQGLPPTDFTGLVPGRTFYAFDQGTHRYWAGASLVPSRGSFRAQVSVQDDGAYLLFTRPVGGRWTAYDDGNGTQAGTACAVVVPPSVRYVWGWSQSTPCGGPAS